jgi:cytochrome c oxidase subunit 2
VPPAFAQDTASAPTAAEAAAAPATDFVLPDQEIVGMAKPWQLGFQPAVTPIKHGIDALHTYVTWIAVIITVFVMLLMGYICIRFREKANPVASKTTHNTLIEIIWTVIPILILVSIAIPTMRLHFGIVHNLPEADVTLKITGNQWYWSYAYPDEGIAFDSNMKKKEELKKGEPYLLAVDNPIVVPVNKKVRLQMTGADVIHSWTIPSFGVKNDVVPGKLAEAWFEVEREGIYYGQCSELCGKFHGFMPIEVRVVSQEVYEQWVASAKVKFAANDFGTTSTALNQ